MDSIIEKISEAESLGINYVFMGIESRFNDTQKPNAWLQCSKYGYSFVESFSLLQIFTEFCYKENAVDNSIELKINNELDLKPQEIRANNNLIIVPNDPNNGNEFDNQMDDLIVIASKKSKSSKNFPIKIINEDTDNDLQVSENASIIFSNSSTSETFFGNSSIDSHEIVHKTCKKPRISKIVSTTSTSPSFTTQENESIGLDDAYLKEGNILINSEISSPTNETSSIGTRRRSLRMVHSKDYSKQIDSKKLSFKKFAAVGKAKIDKNKKLSRTLNLIKSSGVDSDSSFKCLTCRKYFDSQTSLNLHTWMHEKALIDRLAPNISFIEETYMYKCNDCDKLFPNKELATMHAWRHRNGDIDNKVRLGGHIPENERAYLCDDCGKRFATLESARGHYKRVHQIDMKSYSCTNCGRTLKSASSLRLHLKFVHSAEAKYSCGKCGKSFKWKAGLSRHIEEHLLKEKGVEPNHTCNHCGKVFQTLARLRIHKYNIRVNKQRKENSVHRYLCFVCGSGFFLNCDLQTHIHIRHPHENLEGRFPQGYIMKHVCSVCNKICADKSKLKSHMRCHTGEKPFSCQYCGKAFAHKHYLKKHNRNLFCLNQKRS